MTAASARPTVVVTGAAGFIGRAVVRRLSQEGFSVRAGVRRAGLPADVAALPGVAAVPLDLDRPDQIRSALGGAALVVHAAYGPDAEMAAECRRLLDAMAQAQVGALVHLSSIAVYGERTGVVTEDAEPLGDLGRYGEAKRACEDLVRGFVAQAPGRRALLLRPGCVYGAGSLFWTTKIVERIRAGAWGDFGAAGDGIAPLIHVDDVAALGVAGVRRLLDGARTGEAVALNVVGPETPTWNHYFAALAAALGAGPLPRLSGGTLERRLTLSIPAKAARRFGVPLFSRAALAPAPGELALFKRKAAYATAAADRLLGPTEIGLDKGLALTFGKRVG